MNGPAKARLPALIALALGTSLAWAQEEAPDSQQESATDAQTRTPGLYTTVDEHEVYIIQDGKEIDIKTGESAYVTRDSTRFVTQAPTGLNWPCGTSYAGGRGTFPTYSIDDLPSEGRFREVIRRFFEEPAIPDTTPRWLAGESHGAFPAGDIEALIGEAWWYRTGPAHGHLADARPKILLVALFPATGQAVVDTNHLEELKNHYAGQDIPVLFQFHEEGVVPISYFEPGADLERIVRAYRSESIKAADVPLWYAGDRHLELAPEMLARVVDIPPASNIDAGRLEQLKEDLRARGFSRKPVTIGLMEGENQVAVDEADRIRAAMELGMTSVPVMLSYYSESSPAERCGLPPPVAVAGVGQGASEAPNPPPPEEVASGN